MTNQSRTPPGVPAGGQFTTSPHDEADTTLDVPVAATGAGLASDQLQIVEEADDRALYHHAREAMRLQLMQAQDGFVVGPGHDGELVTYIAMEMGRRGLNMEADEVFEPTPGDPATSYSVTTWRGTERSQTTCSNASEALDFTEERRLEEPGAEIDISAINEHASRTAFTTNGGPIRYVDLPAPETMTADERQSENTRLYTALSSTSPNEAGSRASSRILTRLDQFDDYERGRP